MAKGSCVQDGLPPDSHIDMGLWLRSMSHSLTSMLPTNESAPRVIVG